MRLSRDIACPMLACRHATRQTVRTSGQRQEPARDRQHFVLRFLAGDIGKHLDTVLDTIQRTLFSRQTRSS
jgi:hypothetical protein